MKKTGSIYHEPVMLAESIAALDIKPNGIYVDLTFGGGGHAKAILQRLKGGQVWAFDQDSDAIEEAKKIEDERLFFIRGNFRFFKHFLHFHNIRKVDGIFADLGVSSHQLNSASRGFAARLDGPLDMRMHQQGSLTAAEILNTYQLRKLQEIFSHYGDIRYAHRVAKEIVAARKVAPLSTIAELKEVLRPSVPRHREYKFYAKVFQALRIAVNDEEGALAALLSQVACMLNPLGRFVVLTYHSGEDRLVKNFIKSGNIAGKVTQDLYGHIIRPLAPLYRKVLRPNAEEIKANNRARSARMRGAILAYSSTKADVVSL